MVELRNYDLQYAAPFAAYRNNPAISDNGFDRTPIPFTLAHATELFAQQLAKIPAERFLIFWNGDLCGEIGIWPQEDIFRLSCVLGYFVAEPFWGKGIATAAIGQMTAYVFATFPVVRISAGVFAHNKASMRALEKNGYFLECIRKNAVVKNGLIQDDFIWVKLKDHCA